jgi:hypothetical protein
MCTFIAKRIVCGSIGVHTQTMFVNFDTAMWCTNGRGEAAEGGRKHNYNDTCIRRMQRSYANAKRFLEPDDRVRSEPVGAA